MGLDERSANRQTPSHAVGFCCEEGVEHTVDILGRQPGATTINTLSGANDVELTLS